MCDQFENVNCAACEHDPDPERCEKCEYRDSQCTCMDCWYLGSDECQLRGFL